MTTPGEETAPGGDVRSAAGREPERLTFDALQDTNVARCNQWPGEANKLMAWSLTDWMCALAGEVGEAANIVKKLRRGDFTLDAARPALADEIADVVIYCALLAARADFRLGEAVARKFNATSEKIGLPHRLRAASPSVEDAPEDAPAMAAEAAGARHEDVQTGLSREAYSDGELDAIRAEQAAVIQPDRRTTRLLATIDGLKDWIRLATDDYNRMQAWLVARGITDFADTVTEVLRVADERAEAAGAPAASAEYRRGVRDAYKIARDLCDDADERVDLQDALRGLLASPSPLATPAARRDDADAVRDDLVASCIEIRDAAECSVHHAKMTACAVVYAKLRRAAASPPAAGVSDADAGRGEMASPSAPNGAGQAISSYWFEFKATGVDAVDHILRAVADAGRSFHHTEQWADKDDREDPSCVERIQAAADVAAQMFRHRHAASPSRSDARSLHREGNP